MTNVEEWVNENRQKKIKFPVWKKFGDSKDWINLTIMFDDYFHNYHVFLNRNRSRKLFTNEHGCVLPRDMVHDLCIYLLAQLDPKTKYKIGTSKNIFDYGDSKFEIIKRFHDSRYSTALIDFCYMKNPYGDKYFLVNNKLDNKRKGGVEFDLSIFPSLVLELNKFAI